MQRLDARLGGFLGREINQRPSFGSPSGLSGNFTSQHRVSNRLAVFHQALFVRLPRQVPDVASAPFLGFWQVGRSLRRRASRRLWRLRQRLVFAHGNVPVAQHVAVHGLHGRLRDGLVRERDQRVASRPVLAALITVIIIIVITIRRRRFVWW